MNILISNKAYDNIKHIINFTLKVSKKYSNRIVKDIYDTIDSIKENPYIGRYVPELKNKHYRERICGNYRIIYIVSEKHKKIFISYIICGKQNSYLFFEVHKKELFDFLNLFLNSNSIT